jgi:GNAT superfamily N-acetyltransferase
VAHCIVGWCGLLPHADGVWRIDIGVVAEFRRQGIGSRLLNAVVAEADAMGCEAVGLELNEDAGQATRLLGSLGFIAQGNDLSKTRYWLRQGRQQSLTAQPPSRTVANEFIH